MSGLAHRNVGRVAPTNFAQVTFRMRYSGPHVRNSESFIEPLPWDDSPTTSKLYELGTACDERGKRLYAMFRHLLRPRRFRNRVWFRGAR